MPGKMTHADVPRLSCFDLDSRGGRGRGAAFIFITAQRFHFRLESMYKNIVLRE